MDISIIIPTYERGEIFNKTLASVFCSTSHLDCEIIVVNDSKKSCPIIPERFNNTKLYTNSNQGCTSARNFGARQASSLHLLFIDDDFIITKESINKILYYLKEYPDKAFNVAWEYPDSLYQIILQNQFGRYLTNHLKFTSLKDILGVQWQEEEMFVHPEGLGSGFLAISKNNFFKAGGYNESFTFAADRDMAKRLQYSNIDVYVIPSIKVYHNEEDRVTLKNFLRRRKYGIKKAVEYKIVAKYQYTKCQHQLLFLLSKLKPLVFFLISVLPNIKIIDRIYFSLANLLFIIFLYEGYTQSKH